MLINCSDNEHGIQGKSFIHSNIKPELPDSILKVLEDGDIILRKGDGPLSFHLSRVTGEPYTHCGVILKAKNQWAVIHTVSRSSNPKGIDGVQTISLESFVKQSADSCLYICRPIFKPNIGPKIANRSKYYLRKKIPFDNSFSMITPEKFYCSELLYYILKDANSGQNVFNIKKNKATYMLMFSTFFETEKFQKVYDIKD